MNNLLNYYQSVQKNGDDFINYTKDAIEAFFEQQIHSDTRSTVAKNLIEFYRYYEDYAINVKQVLTKFSREMIEPMQIFLQNLTTIYTENLDEMKIV